MSFNEKVGQLFMVATYSNRDNKMAKYGINTANVQAVIEMTIDVQAATKFYEDWLYF